MKLPPQTQQNPKPVLFTEADAHNAYDSWGANCGPGAIAAMTGMTLDQLRPHLGDFESKGYTNPTLMYTVLRSLGVDWKLTLFPSKWPSCGLVRVQWEGPWTKQGIPMSARYRHTHWIGAMKRGEEVGIFDINAIHVGGWIKQDAWETLLVPWLLERCEPKANGKWHLTHAIEIAGRAAS